MNFDYIDINLNELEMFFSTALRKIISKMNITTLKELFELSEKEDFINYFIYADKSISPMYQEMIGTIKLLKYKYLGINPRFNLDSKLEDFGISRRTISCIMRFRGFSPYKDEDTKRFYKENNIYELINLLTNERVLNTEFIRTRNVGKESMNEAYNKFLILKQYFSKQIEITSSNSNGVIDEIKELYLELEELLKQQEILNKKIALVRFKLNAKINLENLETIDEKNSIVRKR